MSRRIIFFNRYVHPDHSATSQLLTDLARHLAASGASVLLVGSRQRYDDANAVLPVAEQVDGFEIRRVGGTRFGRNSLPGRAIDYLSYVAGAGRLLLRELRAADTVVLMTDPPLLGAVLGPLARWRGASCVHWLQDLFPEVAEVLLGRFWSGWRTAGLRWLRDRSLRSAHRVVAISPAMAEHIAARGVPRERIEVIENWTTDAAIQPIPREHNPLRESWGLAGKFVVGYSGNLGRAHDWRTMLEVASLLSHRRDIHFLLIGGGHGLQTFAAAAAARGLAQVTLQPYQSRDALAESLSVPDLHWLSLLPGLDGLIFPSKLYGILAAGRPALFIGSSQGEIAQLLRATGCGVSVEPGCAASAAEHVQRMADDPMSARSMGERARGVLNSELTQGAALRRWSTVLLAEGA